MSETRVPSPRNAAGWSIRRYEREDLREVGEIFRRGIAGFHWYNRTLLTTKHLRASLEEGTAWVATEPRAGVVGFITLYERESYIHYLFIAEDWKFCGIATGLLAIARARAGTPLELKVDAANTHGRAFYTHLGWQETGERGDNGSNEWLRLRSL
ncbi:MAG: GNAT family N-acetyltransferase [Hyphomonadaceae bacterium]